MCQKRAPLGAVVLRHFEGVVKECLPWHLEALLLTRLLVEMLARAESPPTDRLEHLLYHPSLGRTDIM